MTDYGGMVRKSDVLGVMATAVGSGPIGRCSLLVNYESALNIDIYGARMNDCAVYFGCVCEGPRSLRRCILKRKRKRKRGIAISLRHSRRHDEKGQSSGGLQSRTRKMSKDASMEGMLMLVQRSLQRNGVVSSTFFYFSLPMTATLAYRTIRKSLFFLSH